MDIKEKIYVFLCVVFSVLVVTGNLIYQKFVQLPIFSIYIFELSVGAIIYPFTFLILDLIAEFYGREKSKFCIKLAISMNIIVATIIIIADKLNATSWSRVSNLEFNHIFGLFSIAFIGSIIASYISQSVDVIFYLWLRRLTRDRLLLIRNILSTAASLLIDTCIVICFLSFFGVLPKDQMANLIINSYTYKLFFTIFSGPLFYFAVKGINTILHK